MSHPELQSERAVVERAYERLEQMRVFAVQRRDVAAALEGEDTRFDEGSAPDADHALRFERDVTVHSAEATLRRLQLGEYALVFGRMDRADGDQFYLGRVGIRDENRHPFVVDWRAPAAEAFYRATGVESLGLVLRRHFSFDRRTLTALHDEVFADLDASGPTALLEAVRSARTGTMRDIVSTVQREQDVIIRSPLAGVLVVEGGPGTGKTAVALHRAAYLLFSHRRRLGRRGVLVVGPNPVFLGYIDQVLPALGESLAELSTVSGLVGRVDITGVDTAAAAKIKGSADMVDVIARAVRDRQRAPTRAMRVRYDDPGLGVLDLEINVTDMHPSGRTHNDARPDAERLILQRAYDAYVAAVLAAGPEGIDPEDLLDPAETALPRLAECPGIIRLLERWWPMLTPESLLQDLYSSDVLLRSAGLDAADAAVLHQPVDAAGKPGAARWTDHDLPLLEEAYLLLGPVTPLGLDEDIEFPMFGHIVIDEVQDLTPMQLRVIGRRSLRGSMTVVGDLAQATGPIPPDSWEAVTSHLPLREPTRIAALTVNYRTPGAIMRYATSVVADVRAPVTIRDDGEPELLSAEDPWSLVGSVIDKDDGLTAILCAATDAGDAARALDAAGIAFGRADAGGLHGRVVLVPSGVSKGLEFDTVVVVRPDRIVAEAGPRALYVALSRATRRLVVLEDLHTASSLA